MSRSRIPRSHSERCICTVCQRRRRRLQREAERARRRPAEDVSSILLQARAAGMTFREIAEQTGLGLATVYRLVRRGAQCDPMTQEALEGLELVEVARRVTA